MASVVAQIVEGEFVVSAICVGVTGTSYSAPQVSYRDKRGKVQRVFGCRNDLEAFRLAKRLAKKAGKDVSNWKLQPCIALDDYINTIFASDH